MIAQALIERGMLESMSLTVSGVFARAREVVELHPYLSVAAVVVLVLLLLRPRP